MSAGHKVFSHCITSLLFQTACHCSLHHCNVIVLGRPNMSIVEQCMLTTVPRSCLYILYLGRFEPESRAMANATYLCVQDSRQDHRIKIVAKKFNRTRFLGGKVISDSTGRMSDTPRTSRPVYMIIHLPSSFSKFRVISSGPRTGPPSIPP